METEFKVKQKKSYNLMRMTYDLTMAVLFLGMAVVMFFAEKLNIAQLINADPLFRYLFGGLCLLYGGFRLYRGLNREN